MTIRGEPVLWQWDRDRVLEISEPGAAFVEFDVPGDEPWRVQVQDGTVAIPDVWLQKAGVRKIWVCSGTRTIRGYLLQVAPRAKPEGYAAGPAEILNYKDLAESFYRDLLRLESEVHISDDEMLETLTACGIVTPASDGAAVYMDSTGKVFVL